MPRPSSTTRTLTDRLLGGRLDEELARRRSEGESYDTIARWLLADHDVHVAAETIRRWCADIDPPLVAEAGGVAVYLVSFVASMAVGAGLAAALSAFGQ